MEDKTSEICSHTWGSISFCCDCGMELTIQHGRTYTCSCGKTYHCKNDVKLLMVDWDKEEMLINVRTLDQIRDALVIAIEKGPIDSAERYANLLTEINQAYVKED